MHRESSSAAKTRRLLHEGTQKVPVVHFQPGRFFPVDCSTVTTVEQDRHEGLIMYNTNQIAIIIAAVRDRFMTALASLLA